MDISFVGYRKVLTEEQKQRYLDKEGKECPFCHGELSHESDEAMLLGGDEAYQDVDCPHCNVGWREHFEVEMKLGYIVDK